MVDKALAVGIVGIADGAVVVDHPLGPVGHGILQLVLMEGIRPPFLELIEVVRARHDGHLGIHEDDLALDIDAGVVVIAQLGSRNAVADIDDFGGDLASGGRPAGNEFILVFIGLLDDPVLDGNVHRQKAALEHERIGIGEGLQISSAVARRLDPPGLEQRGHPGRAGVEFGRAGQPAGVFLGAQLLNIVEQGLAVGQRRRRPLAGLGAGQGPGRGQEKREKDGGLAMLHAGLRKGMWKGLFVCQARPKSKRTRSGRGPPDTPED